MQHAFSERMKYIGPNIIREIAARAKPSTTRFDMGDHSYNPPRHVSNGMKVAIDAGKTKYCSAAGLQDLREAIAGRYTKLLEREITFKNVAVTAGSEAALFSSVLANVNKGNRVLLPNPGFPNYEPIIRFAEGVPVPINLVGEDFSLDLPKLEETVKSVKPKMAILNWPNNPTGSTIEQRIAEEAVGMLVKNDVIPVSDEVYEKIIYEGKHVPLGRYSEKVRTVNSFSKTYAMTGLRVGYYIGPDEKDVDVISRIQNIESACPNTPGQWGALATFEKPDESKRYVDNMVEEFRKRRNALVEELNSLTGVQCRTPPATFYVFPNIGGTGMSDKELSDFLIENANITTVPGTAFGANGLNHLRLSYSITTVEQIKQAGEKMRASMKSAC